MHRLAADSPDERAAAGQQILRFRQTLLVWCAQAIDVARPLTFPNIPQKPADPFRATSEHGAAVAELARALGSRSATRRRRTPRRARSSRPRARTTSSSTGASLLALRHSPSTTPPRTRPSTSPRRRRERSRAISQRSARHSSYWTGATGTPPTGSPSPGAIVLVGRRWPRPWTSASGSPTTASTRPAGARGPSPSEARQSRESLAYSRPNTTSS